MERVTTATTTTALMATVLTGLQTFVALSAAAVRGSPRSWCSEGTEGDELGQSAAGVIPSGVQSLGLKKSLKQYFRCPHSNTLRVLCRNQVRRNEKFCVQ